MNNDKHEKYKSTRQLVLLLNGIYFLSLFNTDFASITNEFPLRKYLSALHYHAFKMIKIVTYKMFSHKFQF